MKTSCLVAVRWLSSAGFVLAGCSGSTNGVGSDAGAPVLVSGTGPVAIDSLAQGNGHYVMQSIGALRCEHDHAADGFGERVPRLSRKDIRGSKPAADQGGDCLGQADV